MLRVYSRSDVDERMKAAALSSPGRVVDHITQSWWICACGTSGCIGARLPGRSLVANISEIVYTGMEDAIGRI